MSSLTRWISEEEHDRLCWETGSHWEQQTYKDIMGCEPWEENHFCADSPKYFIQYHLDPSKVQYVDPCFYIEFYDKERAIQFALKVAKKINRPISINRFIHEDFSTLAMPDGTLDQEDNRQEIEYKPYNNYFYHESDSRCWHDDPNCQC